ncbi:MAG: RpoL/Rpb11 RNA polymerase subunit family protein [Candidatus Caldarchaeales archaeon]
MGIRVRVVERSDLHLVLEVEGVDFSVLDSLQEVLNGMEEVEYAGTALIHPLHQRLRFVLRVKRGHDVRSVLGKGLARLRDLASSLRASIEDAVERVRGEARAPQR